MGKSVKIFLTANMKHFVAAVLLANSVSLTAQLNSFPDYSYKPDKQYFKSYWTVTKKITTGPARWKGKEWGIAAGVVTAGVVLYIYDDDINLFFQERQTAGKDNVSKYVFEPWGSGLYPAALLGGLYVYGLAANSRKARQVALGGVQVFVMTAISTQIVKHLVHRHRPYQDEPPNPRLWEGPFRGREYTSFPSGHTSTAFALASFFSSVYKDKIWVGILSYGIATGVGLSRIYDNKHWASDVLAGAALGYAIGKTVFFLMDGRSNLSMGVSNTGGVALVYHF
ncbi:MAG: phosphatase PAP2 family protein [Bacteroidales bacterium]|nr:phosphatase PAP2 family protein [Bacteroidales bacterium]